MSDYEKLKTLYDEIDSLILSRVKSSDPRFETWQTKVERLLKKVYGESSEERINFLHTVFSPIVYTSYTTDVDYIEACADGLKSTKSVLSVYLEEMADNSEEHSVPANIEEKASDFSKVFIVHGHDDALKEAVARLVERQNIKAIILNEQANGSRALIEKLEGYSDVGGAICLFTPDDEGKEKGALELSARARQNVVFEAGYFMGKLGRNKTIILSNGDVELPSDMQGIVYTNNEEWRYKTLKELKAMGYAIDFEQLG